MQVFGFEKKRLNEFLEELKKNFQLIAPVKRDITRFEIINDVKEINLEKNPLIPVKQYFFKAEETLFHFNSVEIKPLKLEKPKRIFFGLRKCDLNAIKHQDMVFIEDAKDHYYRALRENSYLIGYHCNNACTEYCFCGSMELVDFYDLMFYDGDNFLVKSGSEKGNFLIKKYKKYFKATNTKPNEEMLCDTDRLKKKDISNLYYHGDWKKGVELCLSCTACTALCPTCYCFESYDEVSTKDTKKGERKRKWSSCQLQEFSRVAGNHIFRKEREDRFKHRIYHQLDYFKKKYSINLCVGCGRCIEGCPTRIDFVKIINEM